MRVIPKIVFYKKEEDFFNFNNIFSYNSEFEGLDIIIKTYFLKLKKIKAEHGEKISFKLDKTLDEEAYTIKVAKDNIYIKASTIDGCFNAIKTLFLLTKDNKVECCHINDKPSFSYRSYMLDVSRHFFTIDQVKSLITSLSLFKINKFHFHLSDDQGFRIESKVYPKLNTIGSYRKENNVNYGGYYTQKELIDLVDFASNIGVEIIPEIDLPSHTNALLSSYNNLSCFNAYKEVTNYWGIMDSILCAGKDSTYEFIETLLAEIIPLFKSKYFHIGGDEANKTNWMSCEDCKKRMRDNNISTFVDLQGYFSNRIIDIVKKYNKIPILWNDALEAKNLSTDFICQFWCTYHPNDRSNMRRFSQSNQKIIFSKNVPLYLDYPHGINSCKKLYNLDIKKSYISDGQVCGIEAPLWTEYIETFEKLGKNTFPRILALSERAWNYEHKNYKSFKDGLSTAFEYLDMLGISYLSNKKIYDPNPLRAIRQIKDFSNARKNGPQNPDNLKNFSDMKKSNRESL